MFQTEASDILMTDTDSEFKLEMEKIKYNWLYIGKALKCILNIICLYEIMTCTVS